MGRSNKGTRNTTASLLQSVTEDTDKVLASLPEAVLSPEEVREINGMDPEEEVTPEAVAVATEALEVTQEEEAPEVTEEAPEMSPIPGLRMVDFVALPEAVQLALVARMAPPVAPVTPEMSPEEREALVSRMAVLREELQALTDKLAVREGHVLVTSKVERPVALLRALFLANVKGYGEEGLPSRKVVLRTAIGKGMAPNTAGTQYQYLRKLWIGQDPTLVQEWEDLLAPAGPDMD